MRTKEEFHKLIDSIEDEEILKEYFKLIQRLNKNQTGEPGRTLNSNEKSELLLSYKESFDSNNLITHDHVKKQHDKWLRE